jgi:tetratricopeptide (TPR) repeat protein
VTYLREAEALAAALDDHHRLGQIAGFLSAHFRNQGAYDQSIAAAQRALTLATADEDVVLQALANQYLGATHWAQGDYLRAIDCLGQTALSLSGARRYERFGQAILPSVQSRAFLAACHAELGQFAEGNVLGEEGLQIAETVAHPSSLMWAYYGVGLLSFYQGDLRRALTRLERAMDICQEANLPIFFPRMAAALGAAYTLAGRLTDAIPLLTQAMEQTTAVAMVGFQALCLLPLGEAHLLAGRLEEAHALAEQALALTRTHQELGNQAYALRLLGEIAARRDPPEVDLAVASYQEALALADELGMRPLVAHCHRGLGTLYAAAGQRQPACTALSTATALYRAMDMVFWLPQAQATLAQAEG